MLNVINGAVHLPTGELRPHDPALMLHRQCTVPYDPAAQCPRFMEFLRQVSCGDDDWVAYLRRCLGYALSGDVSEERAFFWIGCGANGKSVLANIMRSIMGTYCTTAPASFLMQARRDPSAATPELAALAGARLVLANEVETGTRLSAQTLKIAVSTEHVAARALYGSLFSFKPTHKLFVRGNHLPVVTDDDEGVWRRIDLVPFDLRLAPADRDTGLEAALMAEAPGILRWMVEGFGEWRRVGLVRARRVAAASAGYRQDSDLLGQWIADECRTGPTLNVPQLLAYAIYRRWCDSQGLRYPAKRSFTRALKERGIGEGRAPTGSRDRLYTGLALINPASTILNFRHASSCAGDASNRHEIAVAPSAAREARAGDPPAPGGPHV